MIEKNISILLSTYNGSPYLKEQIDSLLTQTNQDFAIWVRDDGSTDSTKQIISEYKSLYSQKFNLVDWDVNENLGFGDSFLRLLEIAEGDLFLFCDQDDIWFPNKLDTILEFYKDQPDKTKPMLIHSDMSYLSDSVFCDVGFFKRTNYIASHMNRILFRGFLPGCTMAFNRSVKDICQRIKYKSSHDFLVYFVAKTYGQVYIIKEKLIRYRLHNRNTVGIGKSTPILFLIKDLLKYAFNSKAYRDIELEGYYDFAKHCRAYDLSLKEVGVLLKVEVDNLGFWERKKWYYNHFFSLDKGVIEGILKIILI